MDDPAGTPTETRDDAELARLLLEQPAIGVARLYDRYGRLVYALAYRVIGDHGTAEEITQDVFVRCWSSIGRYQPERGSLVSWLLAIAHHRAIDELRSRRNKTQRRELSGDLVELLPTEEPALDDVLLRDEVRTALNGLPDAQREAIELIFWGGLTRREAATQLGVPLGTIHTRLRLGMDKLRSAFQGLFGDE